MMLNINEVFQELQCRPDSAAKHALRRKCLMSWNIYLECLFVTRETSELFAVASSSSFWVTIVVCPPWSRNVDGT